MRRKVPERGSLLSELRARGLTGSLALAGVFALLASAIVMLREESVGYKPGQYVAQDILSRVDFSFRDDEKLTAEKKRMRDAQPRVYKKAADSWETLQQMLLELPDRIGSSDAAQLPLELRERLQIDAGSDGVLNVLRQYQLPERRPQYAEAVGEFIKELRTLIVLPKAQRDDELAREGQQRVSTVMIVDRGERRLEDTFADTAGGVDRELYAKMNSAANAAFSPALCHRLVNFAIQSIRPTHVLDESATAEARNRAEALVDASAASTQYKRNQVLVEGNRVLTEKGWHLLKAEKEQFVENLGRRVWKSKLGLAGLVALLTGVLSAYIYRYQGRIVRNNMRGLAIVVLLLSMLLLAQLSAIGKGDLYIFGLAPTILVAMIITIAYDQRFAVGVGTLHGLLVTIALDQGAGFFVILWVGVITACFLLDEIRTRSKLIEVGGATSLAMIGATAAAGAVSLDPIPFIARNCLHAGAAGLAVGFVILGILPFIEKLFRITTAMTLLELADASQPLLRRLALEAPGTYNHSLQVATLAEAAAEAIGANSLLCRVAAYYHDIGKINKADYFVENQSQGRNRHINLSPSVSLLIIIGHVKDGVELAKLYNLPPSILPFIQQHHGTTLVEYFYHRACTQQDTHDPEGPEPCETQYRYPGPKPKSREIAILMVADAVESAVRAMPEPNASRVEQLVHEIAKRRMEDGQFDECDLTFRELELIERALTKTLLGIYHGRIQYPSTATLTSATGAAPGAPAAGRSGPSSSTAAAG